MGIGSKLMEKFKGYLKSLDLTCIVAYADNQAVRFFEKIGFQTLTRQQRFSFKNHIELYNRATLMGLVLNENEPNPFYPNSADKKEFRTPCSHALPKMSPQVRNYKLNSIGLGLTSSIENSPKSGSEYSPVSSFNLDKVDKPKQVPGKPISVMPPIQNVDLKTLLTSRDRNIAKEAVVSQAMKPARLFNAAPKKASKPRLPVKKQSDSSDARSDWSYNQM